MAATGGRDRSNDPIRRLSEQLKNMQRQIDELRANSANIPLLDADPDDGLGINVWFFRDGRLNFKIPTNSVEPRTYNIYRTTLATGGTTTSGTLLPTIPTAAVSKVGVYSATWSQSYLGDSSQRSDPAGVIFTGYDSNNPGFGAQKSFIGFDSTTIAADLTGSTVYRVTLDIQSLGSNSNFGTDLYVGTHSNTSAPANWINAVSFADHDLISNNESAILEVPTSFATTIRDSSTKGISLEAPNNNLAYYGAFAGFNYQTYEAPTLSIYYFG